MGQAKARGSLQERIHQSVEAQKREEPINVPCKTCKEPLNGFTLLKASAAGAAWQKTCSCGALTTALVQSKNSTLNRTFKASLGLMKEIAGDDRKLSVDFLEKSLDTIETGIVRL